MILLDYLAAGAMGGAWFALVQALARVLVRRRRRSSSPDLFADSQPGQLLRDGSGREWITLDRTYQGGAGGDTLTVNFAAAGSDADPRVRYRLGGYR